MLPNNSLNNSSMNFICMQGYYYCEFECDMGYLWAAGFSAVPAVFLVSVCFNVDEKCGSSGLLKI